jgi:hypothetical protein
MNIPGAVGADRSASNKDGKSEIEGSRETGGDIENGGLQVVRENLCVAECEVYSSNLRLYLSV